MAIVQATTVHLDNLEMNCSTSTQSVQIIALSATFLYRIYVVNIVNTIERIGCL